MFLALKCPHGIYEIAKGYAIILVDLEKGKPVARWGRKAEDLFKKRQPGRRRETTSLESS
jgi:hypothetical protein